ncbi:MAG: GNAT family N-acetyltransferase [Betaproteobacteria bacterium]|nr:GNAT family N-acetyltransferase [Betaproteobacteria bacterium]
MPEVMILAKSLSGVDRGALAAHFLALDAEDRRLRFGVPIGDAGIRDYVARIDFDRDAAFGVYADNLSLLGVAHVAVADGAAELGVSVLEGHRGRGVGTALLERAAAFARNRFIGTLFMHCLSENTAMMRIARKSGMKIVTRGGEADARLTLPPLDAATIAAEWLQDSVALFDYNLKNQVLAAHRLASLAR